MLYDPKWEKPEVKADPFSLESLIAWLEKQPADQTYNAGCISSCLLWQWAVDQGLSDSAATQKSIRLGGAHPFEQIAITSEDQIDYPDDQYTFGAALERARVIASRI